MKVLFFEPDSNIYEIMEKGLKKLTSRAEVQNISQEQDFTRELNHFVKIPAEDKPDLILLDIKADPEAGLNLLRTIKTSDVLRYIPVIGLVPADEKLMNEAYFLHANCCIVHPEDSDKFRNIIHEFWSYWTEVAQVPHKEAFR